ncbi:protein AF-9 [Zophobas morio]|uniref:protein AF-9 n=1 Tax=Zophobas morio TaxID=2755281 RepID=UPI003083EA23
MAVRIYLEIGHEASIRTKKTQEGFTHDWEVFVRGCDAAEIHYYIEKVVFYLHETFPKPKRVVKEPPYSVKESGYAGFNLPIDIYLRNNNEPKKIRFNYDLNLQQSGPPIIKVQKEKYIFNSPAEDFRMKLLKGGAIIGSSSSSQDMSDSRSSLDDKNQMTNKPKLSGCDFVKKQKMKVGEPCRDFQELFGSPINMSSKMSEQKMPIPKPENKEKSRTKHSPHKETHKDKEKKDKTDSDKKNRDEKKQKEKSKDRERSKDKNLKKDKSPRPKSPSPKRSPKRTSPTRFSSPPVIKHKESKHDKEKKDKVEERKPKKEKKNKEHKESKHIEEREEHKESKVRNEIKKDESKVKNDSMSPPPPKLSEKKDKSNKEKSSKETPKEDRYSEKYKHKKRDKEKREKKEEKPYKSEKKIEKPPPETKPSLFKPEPHVKKEKLNYVSQPNIDDESSNSSTSSSNTSLVERPSEKKNKPEMIKAKEEKNQKLKKDKGYQDNTIKCKRKSNSGEGEEPPEKVVLKDQVMNNNSDGELETQKPVVPIVPEGVEDDYFGLLRGLQTKIMALKDNSDLQKVVKLIAETGRYEVSAHTFDFDLCLLDRSTVQQLQDFFSSET